MLKYVKGSLESIVGVEIFPIISLLIFFIFFVLLLLWVFSQKKEYIDEVSHLPLENDGENDFPDKEYNL